MQIYFGNLVKGVGFMCKIFVLVEPMILYFNKLFFSIYMQLCIVISTGLPNRQIKNRIIFLATLTARKIRICETLIAHKIRIRDFDSVPNLNL